MLEPTTPLSGTSPTPDPELKKISDTLSSLSDQISSITENVTNIQTEVETLKTTPEPTKPEEPPKWQPKSWDEFPKLAEETARKVAAETIKQTIETNAKARQDAQKQADDQQARMDTEWDSDLADLEKDKVIPLVTKPDDPNDPGRVARKEVFGLGIKYNTPDIKGMATLRKQLNDAGYSVVVEKETNQVNIVKTQSTPWGQSAPVGSSSRTTDGSGKPDYKTIHLNSMDQLKRRFFDQ